MEHIGMELMQHKQTNMQKQKQQLNTFAYWRNKVKPTFFQKYKQTIITAIIFATIMAIVSFGIKAIINYSIMGIQGISQTQIFGSNDVFWFVHN